VNQQKPEPRAKGDGTTLDFHSMFFTIQGEGPYAGHRAIFVRLAGCNLQCPGCDTEYTQGRLNRDTADLVRCVFDMATDAGFDPEDLDQDFLVVITGGEPLRQSIGQFVTDLISMGLSVQIESNGVFAPDPVLARTFDSLRNDPETLRLVVSPKTSRINEVTARYAHAFKYVLDCESVDERDGLPIKALEHPASTGVARPKPGKPVYLNPFDAQDEERNLLNLRAAAASAMKHGYILGVQIHKLIGLE
jgi:7-carboxy-7-deazaguanine synthase